MHEVIDYPGSVKLEFAKRLPDDWQELADLLEIPAYVRRGFPAGQEAGRIWEWLGARGKLGMLPQSLELMGRDDLARLFDGQARITGDSASSTMSSNIPSLPSHYVERADMIASLEASLLSLHAGPGARLVSLTGMAGAGKSVTARAVARRPGVSSHFTDGVVWLSLGKTPDIQSRQNQLIEMLGGVASASADQQQANARINDLLRGRSLLLVLDDVWAPEHLRAFDIIHPAITVLFTTRDRELFQAEVIEQPVGVLDELYALRLFARHLDIEIEELTEQELGIIGECAGLPLALAVAGGAIAGRRWYADSLLQRLRAGRVDQLDIRLRDYPYPSLLRALDASTEELGVNQLEYYLSLAVFTHVDTVPCATVSQLWRTKGLSQYEVQDLLVSLDRRSLLALDSDSAQVTIHSLLYDYIALCINPTSLHSWHYGLAYSYLDDWGGLEDNLPALRPAPDLDESERYGVAHLVFHLAECGRIDDIHRLLALSAVYRAGGGDINVWYNVRSAMHQDLGYLRDVQTAWEAAADRHTSTEGAPADESTALCLRYGLITASLTSIAGQTSPQVLSRLAHTGAWPSIRCLHHAMRFPTPEGRAEALALLLPFVPERDVDGIITEVLAALPHVAKNRWHIILTALADWMSPRHARTVLEAMIEVRSSGPIFVSVTRALLPALTEPLARQALESTVTFKGGPFRAMARACLAQFLPSEEQVEVLLESLFEAASGGAAKPRQEAIVQIVDALPEEIDDERVLSVLHDQSRRARTTSRIAMACVALPLLTENSRQAVLDNAQAIVSGLPTPLERSRGLAMLAGAAVGSDRRALADAVREIAAGTAASALRSYALASTAIASGDTAALQEAFEASVVSARQHGGAEGQAFLLLCPHLPSDLLDRAVEVAWTMAYQRGMAVAALAPRLDEEQLSRLLRRARKKPWLTSQLLPQFFRFLPQSLIPDALSAIEAVKAPEDRSKMLRVIAPHMDAATASLAVPLAMALEDPALRYPALAALVARMSPDDRLPLMAEAVADILSARTEHALPPWVDAVSEYLDERQLLAITASSEMLGDAHLAASALAALMVFSTPFERGMLLNSAAALVPKIADPGLRARCLIDLSVMLPRKRRGALLAQAFESIDQVGDVDVRLGLVLAAVSAAPHTVEATVRESTLAALAVIPEPHLRAETAATILRLLKRDAAPEPAPAKSELETVARACIAVSAAPKQVEPGGAFAPLFRLTGSPTRKLAFAMAATDEPSKAAGLVAAAPYLPPELLAEAAAGARCLQDRELMAGAIHAVADATGEESRNALLAEAYRHRLALRDSSSRVRIAASFLPLTPAYALLPAGHCLLKAAEAIEDDLGRCRAAIALGRVVPASLVGFTLHLGHRITDAPMRASAIAAICPRLPDRLVRRAALEAAAAAEVNDPRVAAVTLAKLSPMLEESDRAQIGQRILRAVMGLASDSLIVESCVELAAVESGLLAEAVLAVSKRFDNAGRAAVLARLGRYCGDQERAFALSHIGEIADPRQRALAVRHLIPDVPDVDDLLEVIKGLGSLTHHQSILLAEIARGRSADVQVKIMEAALTITRGGPRIAAILTVGQQMYGESELSTLQEDLLLQCRKTKKHRERALGLANLAAHMRPEGRGQLMAEVLVECLMLPNPHARANDVATASPPLMTMSIESRRDLLDSALQMATHRGRPAIVACLPLLMPLILSEAGEGALSRSVEAVLDTFKWWA